MSGELRFDGKVVIVTGAGRNLGREYALLFAARGASVVVNDLGVGISDTDGVADAPASPPADDVVDEIVAAGGAAVANYDTVATPEGGAAIVEAALDAFGTVDVVVNNAGQVRMAPFPELTEAQVDAVIDTQLRGALNVGRPAWRVMAAAGGGRFVNVSSGAAFGGVPGGAVYGMAKMGVIGLTRAMASEGRAVGIAANVIAPYAKTRPVPASARSRPARSSTSGWRRGWWRRSSAGWPTRRARSQASASAWAAGTTRASGSRSPRGSSTGTRRSRPSPPEMSRSSTRRPRRSPRPSPTTCAGCSKGSRPAGAC